MCGANSKRPGEGIQVSNHPGTQIPKGSALAIACQLEGYLELRHKLGFKLRLAGGLLRRFVLFAQRKKASVITSHLALEWATQPADSQPAQWAIGLLGGTTTATLYIRISGSQKLAAAIWSPLAGLSRSVQHQSTISRWRRAAW
jgi:hypothetical protein